MEVKINRDLAYKNPLTLAYVGDSVFSLMVRKFLVYKYDFKVNTLNKKANAVVCARAQAEIMLKMFETLTEEEKEIVNRARNCHLGSRAKNSTLHEYSLATQFEAVVGFWYLNHEEDKLNNMFVEFVQERL